VSYQWLLASMPAGDRPTVGPPHGAPTGEAPHQRLNRRYAEILQAVRVAQIDAQVMLGFLLTLAFTPRFGALNSFQLGVYLTSLVIGAGATALLIGLAASHFVYFGLFLFLFALSCELLLVLDVILGPPRSIWITGAISGWFGTWWSAVPLWIRARHRLRHRRIDKAPAERPKGAALAALPQRLVERGHR
jgi:hypothetical protein